ncbi:unnamed protein product [Clonostachys chloroleuca]|uniref:Luciferase-like domain-containing protein n=1 Tax=Clonostachys chloroleuca TaxID=1926264 RepID=A0AA35QF26_9HYPO|nr:unnamed protein product [Clonostachys chloroleuca]
MARADERKPKDWILNTFTMSTTGHLAPGLWRHPRNQSAQYTDIEYWTNLVKILEDGKFHGLCIVDVLSHYGVYKGAGNIDPSLPSAAQFPITDHFSDEAPAVWNYCLDHIREPILACKSTLDHLTKGRVAWNAVTSHLETAAKNLGLPTQIAHDERYEIADDFLTVTYKLWESSWRDDAVVKHTKTKQYTVPGSVRHIDHKGKHFSTAGPLTTELSIQRTPFIFQAGASTAGKAFATKHAECMFVPGIETHKFKKSVDEIRHQAVKQGRNPDHIKIIGGILIPVDETDKKRVQNMRTTSITLTLKVPWLFSGLDWYDEDFKFTGPGVIQSMITLWSATVPGTDGVKWTKKRIAQELALGGPHPRAIGSPQTRWIDESTIDGFNISYAVNPGHFEDISKWLLPELRACGVFWDDYAATTIRENFLDDGLGP